VNSPGGTGDMLTPTQFQQQFNLPLSGTNSSDTWNSNNDQYGSGTNNNDPYSQWANSYGQWPQSKIKHCFFERRKKLFFFVSS